MSGLFDQVVNYSPPLLTAGQVNYDGTWNAATNTPTLINPPDALSKGDYYVVSAAGTQFSISFAVGDWIISNGTAWEKVDLTDAVSSVFGRTGAVVGVSTDYSAVGLTNTAVGAANPSTGAFTSLSSSSTTTLNGTTVPANKTLVVTTDKLSALAATTSAELAGVISDETGSGSLVFANSPTLVTPALGTPSALVGTNITGTAAAFNINGTVGATTPSTVAATSVTALSNSGYQAVVGQLTSGDRVGISGQSSGSGTALVFFDNAQTTFRPAIFDASSHSLKISGVEKASVTSTGLQGAIGATTASTGAFTTVSATTPIAVASGGTGVSTSTGTTNVVLSNSPTLVTPNLGTPSAVVLTNASGTASINTNGAHNGTVGATTPSTIAATTGTFTGNIATSQNLNDSASLSCTNSSSGTSARARVLLIADAGNAQVFATSTGYTDITGAADSMVFAANSLSGGYLFSIDGNPAVAKITSTGLNSTAIGATTPSTVAATSVTASAAIITSSNIAAQSGGLFVGSSAKQLYLRTLSGVNRIDSYDNPITATVPLNINSSELTLQIADTTRATLTSTGLAVTGALSSTTGANFATSSGSVGIGTASPSWPLSVVRGSGGSEATYIGIQNTGTGGREYLLGSTNNANGQGGGKFIIYDNTGTANRLTIDNSGNVGIGTSSPSSFGKLAVLTTGTSTGIALVNGSGASASNTVSTDYYLPDSNTGLSLVASIGVINPAAGANRYGQIYFSTSFTGAPIERMRIDNSGNVGIGTTSPAAKIHVVSDGSQKLGSFINTAGTDTTLFGLYVGKYANDSTTSQRFIGFSINNDNNGNGQINANGASQAAFGSFSDARLKENIVTLDSQLPKILALRPVEFDYKDGSGHQTGFVAQEMQEIYPDAVGEADGYLTITGFGKTEARLVKALQELNANLVAELQSLRQRVAALESN